MDEDRPQCVGHLPFGRQTTANGSFSILRTETADPKLKYKRWPRQTFRQRTFNVHAKTTAVRAE